jgi:heat shock protein HtpX
MTAMMPFLDARAYRLHRLRNTLHTFLLVGGLGLLVGFCTWLIWGGMGVAATLAGVGLIFAFAPRLPPEALLRLYRARRLDQRLDPHAAQILHIVDILADRAELPAAPRVYLIPSMTLNAFAAGTPEKAVIAITEGLRRRLEPLELAGVLAHEISHVRNQDLAIMGIADVLTRCMQWLAYLAVILAVINLPAFLLGDAGVPLLGLVLLYLAPTAGSLIQLALSRAREYDADQVAVSLAGDRRGLISALRKLERYQGRFWEDMRLPVPVRSIPDPSLLRSHPKTEDRIRRLEAITEPPQLPPIDLGPGGPADPPAPQGPVPMRPRQRWTGVWF